MSWVLLCLAFLNICARNCCVKSSTSGKTLSFATNRVLPSASCAHAVPVRSDMVGGKVVPRRLITSRKLSTNETTDGPGKEVSTGAGEPPSRPTAGTGGAPESAERASEQGVKLSGGRGRRTASFGGRRGAKIGHSKFGMWSGCKSWFSRNCTASSLGCFEAPLSWAVHASPPPLQGIYRYLWICKLNKKWSYHFRGFWKLRPLWC